MATTTVELKADAGTAGQSINTPLSPNANSVATASGDANNSTTIALQFQGRITYSSLSVTTGNTTVSLAADTGNQVVTFLKGLTVTYNPQNTTLYNILLDGNIIDSGILYQYTGFVLGTFARHDN